MILWDHRWAKGAKGTENPLILRIFLHFSDSATFSGPDKCHLKGLSSDPAKNSKIPGVGKGKSRNQIFPNQDFQKRDPFFSKFPTFSKMVVDSRPFLKNWKTCSKRDRVFGNICLAIFDYGTFPFLTQEFCCFWRDPNSDLSDGPCQALRMLQNH